MGCSEVVPELEAVVVARISRAAIGVACTYPEVCEESFIEVLIAECAKEGDELSKEIYALCGRKLGYGLSIIADILNPERIVSGLKWKTLAISPAMQKPQTLHCSVP